MDKNKYMIFLVCIAFLILILFIWTQKTNQLKTNILIIFIQICTTLFTAVFINYLNISFDDLLCGKTVLEIKKNFDKDGIIGYYSDRDDKDLFVMIENDFKEHFCNGKKTIEKFLKKNKLMKIQILLL